MQFNFDPKGIDPIRRRAEVADTRLQLELRRMLLLMLKVAVPIFRAETPRGAHGGLARSTQGSRIIETPTGLRAAVLQNARSLDGYPYGAAVRGGTRPHFMPRRAIEGPLTEWAMAKLGLGRLEATRAAWGIARNISRRGTRANRYHVRALQKAMPQLRIIAQRFNRAFAAWIAGR
jgi:hypothetical protein